jgi:hypothetical protein
MSEVSDDVKVVTKVSWWTNLSHARLTGAVVVVLDDMMK